MSVRDVETVGGRRGRTLWQKQESSRRKAFTITTVIGLQVLSEGYFQNSASHYTEEMTSASRSKGYQRRVRGEECVVAMMMLWTKETHLLVISGGFFELGHQRRSAFFGFCPWQKSTEQHPLVPKTQCVLPLGLQTMKVLHKD